MDKSKLKRLEDLARGRITERKAVTVIKNEQDSTLWAVYSDGSQGPITEADVEELRQGGEVFTIIVETYKAVELTKDILAGVRTE